jgi:hypothetical protein
MLKAIISGSGYFSSYADGTKLGRKHGGRLISFGKS